MHIHVILSELEQMRTSTSGTDHVGRQLSPLVRATESRLEMQG